jgi:hypothetical protein
MDPVAVALRLFFNLFKFFIFIFLFYFLSLGWSAHTKKIFPDSARKWPPPRRVFFFVLCRDSFLNIAPMNHLRAFSLSLSGVSPVHSF